LQCARLACRDTVRASPEAGTLANQTSFAILFIAANY
jgi:hypothetical protein